MNAPITHRHLKLLDAAEAIRLHPDKTEAAFMVRQLVQATLPHKNPGDVPAWSRTNGNLTLTIRPGWDSRESRVIGYPYGTVPRLLLFWITTEAIKTKSRRLELGNSLTAFMRQLGFNWLQVLGTTETPHIDQGVRHQFHPVVALLDVLETEQQPFEFVLPRKRPLDALP